MTISESNPTSDWSIDMILFSVPNPSHSFVVGDGISDHCHKLFPSINGKCIQKWSKIGSDARYDNFLIQVEAHFHIYI